MLTILHGDNILASRKALESAKLAASEKEIIKLEGKKTDLPLLKQALEAKSLFAENKLVVVEDLITDNRKQITENVINYLIEGKFDADLVLWEGKPLPIGILSKFKKAGDKKTGYIKIQLFKQPAVIFKFLDSIKPKNIKEMLTSLKRSIEVSQPEIVFYMLVRQFRILLAVKAKEKDRTIERNNDIEELKRLAAWQLGRLKIQASHFSLEQLLKIYKELLIIDYQIKTGKSALDLTKRMELFIMSL